MKRRQPNLKRGAYKPAQLKPLTPEAQRRQAERLRTWKLYMGQLLCAEAERP